MKYDMVLVGVAERAIEAALRETAPNVELSL
jgi:hypothetical protein